MRRLAAAVLIALFALVAFGSTAPASPDVLDLGGSLSACRARAALLLANDPAVWREAQFRLAAAGPAALEAIDTPRLLGSAVGRERITPMLGAALALSVTVRDLEAHPRLMRLAREPMRRAFPPALELSSREMLYEGSGGPLAHEDTAWVNWSHQRYAPHRALDSLGGFALPAVFAMLHHPNPVARALGCVRLAGLNAVPAADSLRALFEDKGSVLSNHDCYMERTPVGKHAREAYEQLTGPSPYPSARFERTISAFGVDLINPIRQTSNSMEATTWAEWWRAARPVWSDYWRLSGEALAPPDPVAWEEALRAYDGFRVSMAKNSAPRSLVVVTGPAGTRCRVESDGARVAEGALPLTYVREEDAVSVQTRAERDRRGDYSTRVFIVSAELADGRKLMQRVLWTPGTRFELEVLAHAKGRGDTKR